MHGHGLIDIDTFSLVSLKVVYVLKAHLKNLKLTHKTICLEGNIVHFFHNFPPKYGLSASFYLFCFRVSQEGIVERLFKWAQEAEQPLRIYATGLLAGAMENQDIAANYREENSVLVSRGFYTVKCQFCLIQLCYKV